MSVLRHPSFKPSYSCIKAIRAYFSSLPKPVSDSELIVVGDRIFTDVVMANRMARRAPVDADSEKEPETSRTSTRVVGPLSVWTTGVWQRESMLMRAIEAGVMRGVERWIVGPDAAAQELARRFVRELPVLPPAPKRGMLAKLWDRIRGS